MKKRIQQMLRKLSSIARNGESGYLEYKRYMDDIIDNNEISIFVTLFETKYRKSINDISLTKLKSKEIYNIIRFNTNSSQLEEIAKLFNRYNMTYSGNIVYDKNNKKIGVIIESDNQLDVHRVSDISDEVIKFEADGIINAYKSSISFILNK